MSKLSLFLGAVLFGGSQSRAADELGIEPPPPPPVVFSIQPEEAGNLVYLPIPPAVPGASFKNQLGFLLRVVNNGAGAERLNNIRVSFPGYPGLTENFSRDVDFNSGQTKEVYLAPDESIRLPQPAPGSCRVELFFDGYVTPRALQRNLAAYQSPASNGFYLFPGNQEDLPANHYWTHKTAHTGGGQYFAYDMGVVGWNGGWTSTKAGTDGSENWHNRAWNKPIYSMGDGVVITAQTDRIDNPAPGTRSLQRMDDHLAGGITDLKMTKLSSTRAASVVRLPSGALKVIIWDQEDGGRQIIRRGDAAGELVTEIATDALSSSRLVTAVRLANGNLRVIVWGVSNDGETVTRLSDRDASAVDELSLVQVSGNKFATAVRRADNGELRLIVWEASDDGSSIALLSHEFAGTASSISTVALSSTRLVTTLRAGGGSMKSIVWDLEDGATTIVRRGDVSSAAVTSAVSMKMTGAEFVTAARLGGGTLRVNRWSVSESGLTVTEEDEANAGGIQSVRLAKSTGEAFVTAVVTAAGNYKNILWTYPDLDRWGESESGQTEVVDIDGMESALMVAGVRTGAGNLKVMTWHMGSGGGNSLRIKYGNVIVLFAHFKEGSVNPAVAYPGANVYAGQYLARLGNSGSSTGPHLHIHATRVSSFATAEELIEDAANGTINYLGYRPIPFHGARVRELEQTSPLGIGNGFTQMWGHGLYFDKFAVRPTWNKPPKPELNIRPASNSLTVQWAGSGFRLQSKKSFGKGRWEDVERGTRSPVEIPMRDRHGFFRLMKEATTLGDLGIERDEILTAR